MAYHLAEEARAGLSEFTIPPDMRDTSARVSVRRRSHCGPPSGKARRCHSRRCRRPRQNPHGDGAGSRVPGPAALARNPDSLPQKPRRHVGGLRPPLPPARRRSFPSRRRRTPCPTSAATASSSLTKATTSGIARAGAGPPSAIICRAQRQQVHPCSRPRPTTKPTSTSRTSFGFS